MISLLPPDEIEDNDVWYRATPIYEDFVQAFDISASNDTEWFRFTVPEGAPPKWLLDITGTGNGSYVSFSLYREAYFSAQDDGSLYNFSVSSSSSQPTISERRSWNLEPGTYYLKASSGRRVPTMSISYKLLPQLDNKTIETAVPLTEKEWQDVWQKGYFSIGEHKAGEVVQIQRDEGGERLGGYTSIYDADGKCVTDINCGNFSFRIPADGGYYLYVPASIKISENEPMRTTRIRYYTHSDEIGVVPSVSMQPNDSGFLDLWFSPEIRNSLKVESKVENLTYNLGTGYLTAPDTPEGSADLVFSNGYPEGDEGRIEAVVHVTWSEKLL